MKLENRRYSLIDIIRLPVHVATLPALVIAAQIVLGGIVPSLQVLATASLIDTAMSMVRQGWSPGSSLHPIVLPLLAVVGLIAFTWVSGSLARFASVRLESALREKFRTAITEKRARLSYRYIEDHDSWDLINRVSKNPEQEIKSAYTNLLDLVGSVVSVAGIVILLVTHVWWAAIIITGFSVPLIVLALKSGKANYQVSRDVTRMKRVYEYLAEVLMGRDSVEERALFGYGERINARYSVEYEAARKIEVGTRRRWFVKMKSGSLLFGVISLAIALVLLQPVLSGTITVGLFLSLVNAAFSLVQAMSWDLTNTVDQLAKNQEYLCDVTAFAALDETAGATSAPSTPAPAFESLELRRVKFAYPGMTQRILNGLSLKLLAGRHYALVGINGAGKTTITKLITGLYDGFEGEILLNGRHIGSYGQNELKAFFSVAYQDFARYYVPARDAVALGDVNSMGDDGQRLQEAIERAGLSETFSRLPNGTNTPLGKIRSGGQDLSGGEWQRVAMARVLMSPAPVRILDEPTAALDPVSESRLYEEYGRISLNKTTIFISHRLGSTKLADEIIVIGDGVVTERGTHADLVDARGQYFRMYESQRSWYQ